MELGRMREEERKKLSHLRSWWKNRNIFSTCLLCLFIHAEGGMERRGNGEELLHGDSVVFPQIYAVTSVHSNKLIKSPGH